MRQHLANLSSTRRRIADAESVRSRGWRLHILPLDLSKSAPCFIQHVSDLRHEIARDVRSDLLATCVARAAAATHCTGIPLFEIITTTLDTSERCFDTRRELREQSERLKLLPCCPDVLKSRLECPEDTIIVSRSFCERLESLFERAQTRRGEPFHSWLNATPWTVWRCWCFRRHNFM